MDNRNMTPAFSIEMQSKKHVKHMSMCCECNSTRGVLFEGALGRLKELSMIEGAVLEIKGTNGVLRIDLKEDELRRMLSERKDT